MGARLPDRAGLTPGAARPRCRAAGHFGGLTPRGRVEQRARAVAGGAPIERDGYFLQPTTLDQVSDGVRVVDEKQFGPVLPLISFRDEEGAIARANNTEYGLSASVWSADVEHAMTVAARIDAGQVSINGHAEAVFPHLPFAGHQQSGVGVENGPWGSYGFTETQVVAGPPRQHN
ncbi:aldehyde dehydrogenase family protein [Streptomyces scopuliridis]|uniref:aldehyde dehydrogenase family protein n=1 Tax=Streptomyces scopuliridis TaxID=452529 RepID=UPI00341C12D3